MLKFKFQESWFSVSRGGRVLGAFRVGDVFCEVGEQKSDYTMNRGSFKLKEKVLRRHPLFIQAVKKEGDTAVVTLTEGQAVFELQYGGERLKVTLTGIEADKKLWFKLPAVKEESVYGTGETFTHFDLRGQKANVWVSEHVNAGQVAEKLVKNALGIHHPERVKKFEKYASYYVQPTFLSSRKYFFHTDATAITRFDFTSGTEHRVQMNQIAPVYLGFGDTFEAVLTNLTDLLGRQITLPDWVFDGEILGIQGGTEIMDKKLQTALDHDMAVCGVWIQDWEGRRVTAVGKQLFWNWEWDKELYPDLDKRVKEYAEKGVKILGYCNPFLAVEKPLYKIAAENGYCVKDKDGNDYLVTITTFPAAMVDLTNPDAYDWIKGVIKENLIGFGLAGWMADFGEYLPTDCVLFSGEDPYIVHNTWPARWARVNREALQETGKEGKIMFFTRAGFTDTVKYSTMMWNGDNHVDFTFDLGLPSVIPAMLSLTCCGFGLSHSDIGGYTTFMNLKRSEELFMRWCEMNAFTPVLRGHEGLNPDLNAQFDASEPVLRHGAAMSRNHALLKPYLMAADKYNSETGVGIVRPLFFYYDEPQAYSELHEYLLGRDILVAPVLEEDAVTREVWLPDDVWIHGPSGKEYRGGTHTVEAPVGSIPVFVRKDADRAVRDLFKSLHFPKESEIYAGAVE
ncbi:MAG: alpha-glucosidase [Clostridia bacterium]|nr:alpha-glucosidase [Clostridia bacterium]